MANRLKGITLEIGGDTTELSKALKNVNSEIKDTQTQLKDVEKLLKLDPKNIELLKQKQKLLTEEIKNTKTKLEELKKAQASMDTSGVDKNSEEYQALRREIIETENELKNLETAANSSNAALAKISAVADSVSTKAAKVAQATQGLTIAIGAAAVASVNAAADWETAFTGVKKTVDATEEEYDQLAAGIQQMATETASSAEDIAAVMEVSGQLGITGVDNLLKFTKVMVELGDTTNLSAEDAATALARFINITGDGQDNVDRLGAAVVDLGNNFATDEASIVEMSTRLASAGTIAGLSSSDILALSTAMSSVGIEAEAGGTAMTQTLSALETAVADFSAGSTDKLDQIAEVANMSSEDFAAAWESDPIVAIQAFIKGLGELDEKGESATLVLDELGMSGIRQSNMLKSLSLASDVLTDAVDTASAAYEENTALTAEAEKRYATFSAKLSQSKEELKQIAVSIGETLIPIVEKVLDKLKVVVNWWNSLTDAQREHILVVAAVVAAISPIASIISKLASAISFVAGTVIPALSAALSFLAANPIVLVIAAIVALIAAIALFGDQIQEILGKVDTWLQDVFATDFTKIFGNDLGNILNGFMATVKNVWESVKQILNGLIDFIRGVFTGNWQRAWQGVQEVFAGVFSGLATVIKAPFNAVISVINSVIGRINSVLASASWAARKVGISLGSLSYIPYLAKGGVVHSGMAVVGEAGPELLSVANGAATVTPLTASVDTKGLASALAGSSQPTSVSVEFTGSLAQLASVLHPYITAESKRVGGNLVN